VGTWCPERGANENMIEKDGHLNFDAIVRLQPLSAAFFNSVNELAIEDTSIRIEIAMGRGCRRLEAMTSLRPTYRLQAPLNKVYRPTSRNGRFSQ
jgi:hypothetical protein